MMTPAWSLLHLSVPYLPPSVPSPFPIWVKTICNYYTMLSTADPCDLLNLLFISYKLFVLFIIIIMFCFLNSPHFFSCNSIQNSLPITYIFSLNIQIYYYGIISFSQINFSQSLLAHFHQETCPMSADYWLFSLSLPYIGFSVF